MHTTSHTHEKSSKTPRTNFAKPSSLESSHGFPNQTDLEQNSIPTMDEIRTQRKKQESFGHDHLKNISFETPQNTGYLPVIQRKLAVNQEDKFKTGNLPEPTQRKMEQAFDADFSSVKVHENSSSAKDLGAVAYTQGEDIHFASQVDLYSSQGQLHLGHELSHVLQQRRGEVPVTQVENGYGVNEDRSLESQADEQGSKAARGESISNGNPSLIQPSPAVSIQKKSQPIQMWRDVPGQIQVESTSPDTTQAWDVFMRAARQSASGHADQAEPELRRMYYNLISQRMRGSFQPINIDAHTTTGFNHHWVGTIRFVFGDQETPIAGGGTGTTTLSGASGSSGSLGTSSSNTVGSSGSAQGGYSQGEQGASGNATVGGSGSTATGVTDTQGDTQSAGSSSQINQQLNRFSSDIGIEVNITASYDMGSSWTDWVNPTTYGAWGASQLALRNGTATGRCGTVIYYRGAGIVTPRRGGS